MPAFRQVLAALVDAWNAAARRDHPRERATSAFPADDPGATSERADVGAAAVEQLVGEFDEDHGGFGAAPKFPPSMVCEFLLRRAARVGDETALRMAEAPWRRGPAAGSTTSSPVASPLQRRRPLGRPALRRRCCTTTPSCFACTCTGPRVVRPRAAASDRPRDGIVPLTEMRTPEGGFASALYADSGGEEGVFYVWTREQLTQALGDDDGTAAAALFGVRSPGNFERGASTLRLDVDPDDVDYARGLGVPAPGRPRAEDATGARRQGRGSLERPRRGGAGRGRDGARRAELRGRSRGGRFAPAERSPHRRRAAPQSVARRRRWRTRRRPRRLRVRRRRSAHAVRRHREPRLVRGRP